MEWPGCDVSFIMLWACLRQQCSSSRVRRGQPTIFWAVLMTLWSPLLWATVRLVYHTHIEHVSTVCVCRVAWSVLWCLGEFPPACSGVWKHVSEVNLRSVIRQDVALLLVCFFKITGRTLCGCHWRPFESHSVKWSVFAWAELSTKVPCNCRHFTSASTEMPVQVIRLPVLYSRCKTFWRVHAIHVRVIIICSRSVNTTAAPHSFHSADWMIAFVCTISTTRLPFAYKWRMTNWEGETSFHPLGASYDFLFWRWV